MRFSPTFLFHQNSMNLSRFLTRCSAIVALLLVLALLALPGQAQYNVKYATQTRGDIVLNGNIWVRPVDGTAVDNNNQPSAKVDIDTDLTTDNSISSVLRIPAGATVLSAQLYWESRIATVNTGPKSIKISTDGTAAGYQTVTTSDVTSLNTGSNGNIYAARADVTNIIKNIAVFPATILAGGAQVETFPIITGDTTGSYAGWGLAVAYQSAGDPIRQLRIFDGFSSVGNGGVVNTTVSGFRTPDAGAFTVKFGVIAFEGDRGITGDQFLVSKDSTNYTALFDDQNPANNFFNSTIGQDGVSFTAADLNPDLRSPSPAPAGTTNNNNSIGLDVDRIALSGPGTFFDNNQTSLALRFTSTGDVYQVTTFTTSIPTAEILGRVFEDPNYSGGAGRSFPTTPSAVVVPGARVELYSAAGAFIKADTTGADGFYSFSNLGSATASTDYIVRVVNSTVVSTRASTATGLVAVQTYRTEAKSTIDTASGSAIAQPVTNRVGGQNPAVADAPAVTTVGAPIPANAQSITTVQLGTAPVASVSFGFNFDTVVNTNDAGQGSLRQFVLNSNALSNSGLAQEGLTAGTETSIFMIPSGADPLGRAKDPNFNNGVAKITLASPLVITGANASATAIDGRTQTSNIGDTNAGTFGSGGSVGVQNVALPTAPRPEVEVTGPNSVAVGLDVQAASALVRNLSMWGFGGVGDNNNNATIRVGSGTAFTAPVITQMTLGASAVGDGGSAPLNPANYGKGDLIRVNGVSAGSVTNSILAWGGGKGVGLVTGANNWTIQSNEIRNNARDSATWDGVDAQVAGTQVIGNLIYNQGGVGIDSFGAAGGALFTNNTVRNNGLLNTPTAGESAGVRVYGTGNSVTFNVISNNYGAGVQIQPGGATLISRNSIFGNGDVASTNSATPSRQIGIDLLNSTDDITHGTSPFVTPNASGAKAPGGNDLLNFPVITGASIVGGQLTLDGFAPAGSSVEVFVAAPDPSGFGEGQTFAFNFVEGSAADTDNTTGSYNSSSLQALGYSAAVANLAGSETGANRFRVTVPAGAISSTSPLTTTATLTGRTSEFSPIITSNAATVSGTVYLDANRNGTLDGTESGTGLNNLFVKAVANGQTSATQAVPVDAATGAFNFSGLAAGSYKLVLSNNATLTDIAPTVPAGYVGTQAPDGTRQLTVGTQSIAGQDFGLYAGAQISGLVFEDNGTGGAAANDGIKNGGEVGLAGVKLNLTKADDTVIDTATTDANGQYQFRVPGGVASSSLKIVEANLPDTVSTGAQTATPGGSYNRASDTITFNYAAGTTYSNLNFGDVRLATFTGEDSKIAIVGSSVAYPHVFTAQTAGTVTFGVAQLPSPNNPDWSVVGFRDSNNGQLDGADAQLGVAPIAVVAGQQFTIFLQNFVPTTAANGAQDKVTVTANFAPTGAAAPATQVISRSDLTTVSAQDGLVLTKKVDKATARSGDVLLYTITYSNATPNALANLIVSDATPAYTTFVAANNGPLPNNLTGVTVINPAVGARGAVKWTFAGTLNPGQSGTVTFQVQVQ